ncbi:hypothetical protein [Methylobacterium fujisawaense]|jgi:hypothetical protein
MSEHQLPSDATRLGLRYRDASATIVDWDRIRREVGDTVVIHPRPDADVLREYGFDDGYDLTAEAGLRDAIEAFEDSDVFHEWKDRNEPMMNYLWPCEPACGVSMERAAQLIARFGGATCLVSYELDDEKYTGIALTGGGMNLAHDIAAAYVCMGHAPPLTVLDDALSQIASMAPEVQQLVVDGGARVAENMRWAAGNLDERVARARAAIASTLDEDPGPSGPKA